MICILEIAMMVIGIITLVKGKVSLTRNRIITGWQAYAIGILLTATLPLILGIGFVIGFTAAMNANGQPVDVSKYAYLDLVILLPIILVIFIIAFTAPKNREENQPSASRLPPNYPSNLPPMGDNPYASPHSDHRDPS